MKVAVAGVYHETNTFAPGLTNLHDFRREWVEGNEQFRLRYQGTRTSMGGILDAAESENVELLVGLYTQAIPSATVSKNAAETIIRAVVESIDINNADGIILIFHGAMVAENCQDVEGTILREVRSRLGGTRPIAITLDLHANISSDMVELSDILVGYDTYPHTDVYDRAVEAFQLLTKQIRGLIHPRMCLRKPAMLIAPETMVTDEGPMKELMEKAFQIENDPNVLNVTVAGGFPFSDIYDAGMAFVVTTNADSDLAAQYAQELSDTAWRMRQRFTFESVRPERAIEMACSYPQGPVVLVEESDNVGGGSPADATHILKHLVNCSCRSLIVIRDPEAVAAAHSLGIGSTLKAHVGGKTDRLHGDPVYIEGTVRLLSDGRYRHIGPYMTGQLAEMGRTAVVEVGNMTLVLTQHRVPPWDLGHIKSLGLEPCDYQIIVVKAAIAWRTAFGGVAKANIYVDTPGCCSGNLTRFQYKNISHPIYPLDLR
ncbi:MAG: M81 family metallopeptidase [Alicyclobacillus sp.]|nr:M81 family metallopeptidase [Alicyclobacillus sp.]